MINTTTDTAVIHLVRKLNGVEPFQIFVKSYLRFDAGMSHDLILVLKGFEENVLEVEYQNLIGLLNPIVIYVADKGFDIASYFEVYKKYTLRYRYFCFLNSYSEILDHHWLKKMYCHIVREEVGLVGATGSMESHASEKIPWMFWIFFVNIIRHFRVHVNKPFKERISLGISGAWAHSHFFQVFFDSIYLKLNFRKYPNYHIRTNSFVISSDHMAKLSSPKIRTKMDAYMFESGRHGLTNQILKCHLKVLIVGRDGLGYEPKDWNKSGTFWQSDQENLLVADNQTRLYRSSNSSQKMALSKKAWG